MDERLDEIFWNIRLGNLRGNAPRKCSHMSLTVVEFGLYGFLCTYVCNRYNNKLSLLGAKLLSDYGGTVFGILQVPISWVFVKV